MVEMKSVSLIKTIVFVFLGAALLYSLYLGERDIAIGIVTGIFGYIVKDAEIRQDNEPVLDVIPGPISGVNDIVEEVPDITDPNDKEHFIME